MTAGLFITAMLMGVVGLPHCMVMCSVPCSVAVRGCGGSRPQRDVAAALQIGRLLGYAVLGGLAASIVSFAHLLADHVTALRPLWVMAQAAILILGLVLLVTGRMPAWLHSVPAPLYKLSEQLSAGRMGRLPVTLRAGAVGMFWAALPCAQLYAAVVLASMANGAATGAAVMLAYAVPSAMAMWLGNQWLTRLLRRDALPAPNRDSFVPVQVVRERRTDLAWFDRFAVATWPVRLIGAVLAVSTGLMLAHADHARQLVCA